VSESAELAERIYVEEVTTLQLKRQANHVKSDSLDDVITRIVACADLEPERADSLCQAIERVVDGWDWPGDGEGYP
jgi:hypothetical protein